MPASYNDGPDWCQRCGGPVVTDPHHYYGGDGLCLCCGWVFYGNGYRHMPLLEMDRPPKIPPLVMELTWYHYSPINFQKILENSTPGY